MAYKYYDNKHTDQQKAIIDQREKNNKLLESSKPQYKTVNNTRNDYEEKKRKERGEHKELIIKKLTDYNEQANDLMKLISEFLESNDKELRERIKFDFKSLKDKMNVEYKNFNRAKYRSNIVEKSFYRPAIQESWAKISSYKYTSIPCQEMNDAIYDVADYTNYYLSQLKECDVMSLSY